MKHSEPKVTIDLAEYNELLEKKANFNGLTEGELSETIVTIINSILHNEPDIVTEYCRNTDIQVMRMQSPDPKERFRITKRV